MTEKNIITSYLAITYAIIIPPYLAALLLHSLGITLHNPVFTLLMIALSGLSTSISGLILLKKAGKVSSYREVLKDFFCLKQPPAYYGITLIFLLIIFGIRIWNGQFQENKDWWGIPLLFLRAILFGGIEEIGWRCLFQPELEKKFSFAVSSALTFAAWGIWHLMYNVVDGSMFTMQIEEVGWFLAGLLATSFVLGAIYHVSKSLWLCVFYHALFNALSQTFIGAADLGHIAALIFSIAASLFWVNGKMRFSGISAK